MDKTPFQKDLVCKKKKERENIRKVKKNGSLNKIAEILQSEFSLFNIEKLLSCSRNYTRNVLPVLVALLTTKGTVGTLLSLAGGVD